MNNLNQNSAGLAVGLLFGLCHAAWAIMVALNWAKPLMDWLLHLHMMTLPYTIGPFHFWTSAWLVLATFVIGYITGWILAGLWNWAQK
ncbi:MAG: hypothetical protein KGJ93_05635 [Patescibacteria group bacterium]|nr:hypothetical protein [Patescibacteria group bacterium]